MRRLTAPFLALLLLAPDASAQQRRETTTFLRNDWRLDAGLVAASGAAFLFGTFALQPSLAQRAPLDGLGHRPRNEPFEMASDTVLAAGAFGSLFLARAIERGEGRLGVDQWRAPLVLAESALLASAIVHLAKNATGTCRPRDWDDDRQRCDPERGERLASPSARLDEAHRAFPSGHVTPMAAMAGASAGLWLFPTGRDPAFLPLTLVSGAAALSLVALRPLAGAHSWVDTGTGFLIGSASGLLVSYLHTRVVSTGGPSLSVSASPVQISMGATF
ncbi:MAG: phosphatase PAP2 family protein [Polyangiaceae bacterium]|jgi:membrane-associated phospholipid phosphatase|nr:phosphatase PAP2 family protein [Polyangiaceae bacterium]